MAGTAAGELDLRSYYDERALELDELRATYESPYPFKRFFYGTRFRRVLEALDPRPGERILDVGCGSGYYTKHLLELGAVVTATEYAANSLAQAQEYAGVGATYRVEDAQDLSFGYEEFDKVLMTEVIEHVPEPDLALREARRVLRPGGLLVVSTPSRFSPLNLAYAAKRRKRGYGFNEHLHEFTPAAFERALARHFLVESLEYANFLLPYPLDLAYMRLGNPGLAGLASAERRLARTPLVKRLGWTMIARARKP